MFTWTAFPGNLEQDVVDAIGLQDRELGTQLKTYRTEHTKAVVITMKSQRPPIQSHLPVFTLTNHSYARATTK